MGYCSIYQNEDRPQICREWGCGKPCEMCGKCCSEIALPGAKILGGDDMERFLAMHGLIQREDDVLITTPCIHYRNGRP